MPQYRYRAQNLEGLPDEGTMEESSAHRVRLKLEERGLKVMLVEPIDPPKTLLRISPQLTWEEVRLFTEQLRAIVKHGLPLPAALGAMAHDVTSSRLRPVLLQLKLDLEQGRGLEEAVARQQRVFPRLYAPMLRAGEASGNLPGVLQLLAQHANAQVISRHTLKTVLAYPVAVIIACFLVLLFILQKVVPVFADVFDEFGGQLPAPTRFWIQVADALHQPYLLHWILGLALAGFLVVQYLIPRWGAGRYWFDAFRMHLPVVGRTYYLAALSRFCRALGLLLRSQVPVVDALELAGASADSPQLERAVEEAALAIAGGERISDALESTGFFPHSFTWLLGTSENRGDIDEALDAFAETAEREAGLRDKTAMALLTPSVVLCVGLLVLSIIVALYLPIFTLGDQISG